MWHSTICIVWLSFVASTVGRKLFSANHLNSSRQLSFVIIFVTESNNLQVRVQQKTSFKRKIAVVFPNCGPEYDSNGSLSSNVSAFSGESGSCVAGKLLRRLEWYRTGNYLLLPRSYRLWQGRWIHSKVIFSPCNLLLQ